MPQVAVRQVVTASLRAVGTWALLAAACSGPQPLPIAVHPHDRQHYADSLRRYGGSPRQAFFAARAAQTGQTIQDLEAADARISGDRNPFKANADPAAVSQGAVLFQALCVRCHGADARGAGPDVLPDHPCKDFHAFDKRFAVTLHGGAPRAWFHKISEGSGPTVQYRPSRASGSNDDGASTAMPAFKDSLAREQVWLVVTYLQSLDAYARPMDGK
ncbi:MAG: cytochrome c [Planctomycetes bacterium]|nr:cytochrome c [Planctomycetota bacterium]